MPPVCRKAGNATGHHLLSAHAMNSDCFRNRLLSTASKTDNSCNWKYPCPLPLIIISFFMFYFLLIRGFWFFFSGLQSECIPLLQWSRKTPLYSNSSFIIRYFLRDSSKRDNSLYMFRAYSRFLCISAQAYRWPAISVPGHPCRELSDMIIVTGEFLLTASSNPVIPEWVKVRITYDSNWREQAGIGSTNWHCNRCTHVDAWIDCIIWRKSNQGY